MRNTLVMLCVLATSLAGYSQEKSFNLNNYKFPDYKRHQLELNLNSNGSSSKESKDVLDNTGILKGGDYSNFTSRSHIELGYNFNLETRKRIDYLNFSVTGDYDYTKTKYNDQKTSESNPVIEGAVRGSKRYYLAEDIFFIEGLANAAYSFRESKRKTPVSLENMHSKSNSVNLTAGLGIGFGRLERVNDLWQAYYILEKLNQQNSFNRQLEEKDIFEFATLASKLKNQRFLDFRTRKIYELQKLDSLLQEQGLKQEGDMAYFTTLNDYWSYGNFPYRASGMELKFWVTPDYYSLNSEYSATNYFSTDEMQKTSLISNASFSYRKQLNLFWERSFNAKVSYEVMLDTVGNLYNYPDNNINTQASFGYGYYPNSRTNLNAFVGYWGRTIISRDSENVKDDVWSSMASFNLRGTYYFSPHLQLEALYSFGYTDKISNSVDLINHNYNLALRYAIF